jgi:hypothetical protein
VAASMGRAILLINMARECPGEARCKPVSSRRGAPG